MADIEDARRKNREKVARWRSANPDRAREHAIRSALAAKERREALGQCKFRDVKSRIKNTRRMTDAEFRAIQEARRAAREAFERMSPEEKTVYQRAQIRERVRRHREKVKGLASKGLDRDGRNIESLRALADQKIALLREKREAARIARLKSKTPG